jgi:hypothetical protein
MAAFVSCLIFCFVLFRDAIPRGLEVRLKWQMVGVQANLIYGE